MSYPNEGFNTGDPDRISDAESSVSSRSSSSGGDSHLNVAPVGGFLSVENYNSEMNQHTYVYDANRDFSGMTLEALPAEDAYRDVRNLKDARPTVEELKSGQRNRVDIVSDSSINISRVY